MNMTGSDSVSVCDGVNVSVSICMNACEFV